MRFTLVFVAPWGWTIKDTKTGDYVGGWMTQEDARALAANLNQE